MSKRSLPARRKSTPTEQLINLGTSTRPIITTVNVNKNKKGSASPLKSQVEEDEEEEEAIDAVSTKTKDSPTRRGRKRRRVVEDDEYEDEDIVEVAALLQPPQPPPPSYPKLQQSAVTRATKSTISTSIRPPFVRKLEEYTSKKAESSVVRWSKDGTRLYIFDKEQMRKDLNELKWLAHSGWTSMEGQFYKHDFRTVKPDRYTEVEQALQAQGTGFAVFHNKDYTFDHTANYAYSESSDPSLNFSADIAMNTNKATRRAHRQNSNEVTATSGGRVRTAAVAAEEVMARLFLPPPSPFTLPELKLDCKEVVEEDNEPEYLPPKKARRTIPQSSTAKSDAVEVASVEEISDTPISAADLPVKNKRGWNLRGANHWTAKANAKAMLQGQTTASPSTEHTTALAQAEVTVAVSTGIAAPVGDVGRGASSAAGRGTSTAARGRGTGRGRGRARGRGRGRGISRQPRSASDDIAEDPEQSLTPSLLETEEPQDTTSATAPTPTTIKSDNPEVEDAPSVTVSAKGRGRWLRKAFRPVNDQSESILSFSSRYPRACRPTGSELQDRPEPKYKEEELYMLYEDGIEGKKPPSKRRRLAKPAASTVTSAELLEFSAEVHEEPESSMEQLDRDTKRLIRAASSSTLVSEDLNSPPRSARHHLRTPTSLSPAPKALSVSPGATCGFVPSESTNDVKERSFTMYRRAHLPTPASLSPFPASVTVTAAQSRIHNTSTSPLTDIDDLDDYQDDESLNIDEAGRTAKLEEIERQDEMFAGKLFGVIEGSEPMQDAIPASVKENMVQKEISEKEVTLDKHVEEQAIEMHPVKEATPATEEDEDISVPSGLLEPEKAVIASLAEDQPPSVTKPTAPAVEQEDTPASIESADIPVPVDEHDISVEELFLINKPSYPDLGFESFSLPRFPSIPSLRTKATPSSLSREASLNDWNILGPKSSTDNPLSRCRKLRRASEVSQIFGDRGLIDSEMCKTAQSTLMLDLNVPSEAVTPAAEQVLQDVSVVQSSTEVAPPSLSQESPSAYFTTPEHITANSASPSRIVAVNKSADPGLYGPFCNWMERKLSYEDLSMELEFNFEAAAQKQNGERLISQFLGVDVPPSRKSTPAVQERMVHDGHQNELSHLLEQIKEGCLKASVQTVDTEKGQQSRAGSEDTVVDDSMRISAPSSFGTVSPLDLHSKTRNLFQKSLVSSVLDPSLLQKQAKRHQRAAKAEMKLVELEKRRSINDGDLPASPPQYSYEDVQPVTPGTSLDTMIGDLQAAEPRIVPKNRVSLTEEAEKEETRNISKRQQHLLSTPARAQSEPPSGKIAKKSVRAKIVAVEVDKSSKQRKASSLNQGTKDIQKNKKKRSIQQDDDNAEDQGVQSVTFKLPRLTTRLNPPTETRVVEVVDARPTHASGRKRPSMRNKRMIGAVNRVTR